MSTGKKAPAEFIRETAARRSLPVDVLRAFAVILVLGRHLIPCPSGSSALVSAITRVWRQGGWVGVDLFFVLSGYLVGGLLIAEYEKNSTIALGRFLLRRSLRIIPPLWLFIFLTILYGFFVQLNIQWVNILPEILFFQNYRFGIWDHTWSIAVEVHFYVMLGVIVTLLSRQKGGRALSHLPQLCMLIMGVCLLLRCALAARVDYHQRLFLFPSHLRMDALFSGVLVAYWKHSYGNYFRTMARRWRYPLIGAGILLWIPAFHFALETTPFIYTGGFTLNYLAATCFLTAALGCEPNPSRFLSLLGLIGSRSYSIYLYNIPVVAWGVPFVLDWLNQRENWFSYAFVCIFGSIFVGAIMAFLTESPVLALRNRLIPARRKIGGVALTLTN